ncbi:DUF4082 domain-containing protein [Inquilinus sp.]|uniref:DUF4082 domain-containing protein n=1 Tax=Inquilinus sp. TaxID=1932117 RepID=UPI0031D48AC4
MDIRRSGYRAAIQDQDDSVVAAGFVLPAVAFGLHEAKTLLEEPSFQSDGDAAEPLRQAPGPTALALLASLAIPARPISPVAPPPPDAQPSSPLAAIEPISLGADGPVGKARPNTPHLGPATLPDLTESSGPTRGPAMPIANQPSAAAPRPVSESRVDTPVTPAGLTRSPLASLPAAEGILPGGAASLLPVSTTLTGPFSGTEVPTASTQTAPALSTAPLTSAAAPTTSPVGEIITLQSTPSSATTSTSNPVTLENQKQGTPVSVWGIHGSIAGVGDSNIEGFADNISVNASQTINFKIDTDSTHYRIDIYRLGYYGGDGARLVATMDRQLSSAQVQPDPLFNSSTREVDAGNWSVSASWAVPSDAVSGVYFAKLTREDGTTGENMIPFIVRNDGRTSGITFQTADQTWEAYNPWGGYNLYQGPDGLASDRAYAVSYNRPVVVNSTNNEAGPQDFVFGAEFPAIYWLEQNGYDVSYISGIDAARNGSLLLNSKVYMDVGHDEYWSSAQRANVQAAADAGVSLAFLSGNEMFWNIAYAPSLDASATPYRTIVEYKDPWSGAQLNPNGTSGGGASTFRDPVYGPDQPENALTGTIFNVDAYQLDTITIPYSLSKFGFWTNTSIANLQPGQTGSLIPNLLGYEWDTNSNNGFRPAGLIDLSSTTLGVSTLLLDYAAQIGAGTATHNLTLYRDPTSGALVFGAGTVYWSWGLSSNHANEATPADPNVQQAMVNLFAEMGVQPQTLTASLVLATASTDHAPPTSTIISIGSGGALAADQTVTISGTATDAGGGRIAMVEISTDGGKTWNRATGFSSWTYSWIVPSAGSYTIETRATDDWANVEKPSDATTVSASSSPNQSLFTKSPGDVVVNTTASSNLDSGDNNSVQLGVRFTASTSGLVMGIRFYKGINDIGTHTGTLWSSSGTVLATGTFTGESASGWQTLTFSSPLSITAGATYVASYLSHGHYPVDSNFFTAARTNGALSTAANAGVYTYSSGVMPTSSFGASNYWVDVLFVPSGSQLPPTAVADSGFVTPENTALTIAASALLANDSDPDGDTLTIVGVSGATNGSVSFNASSNTVTFTPNANYAGPASFTYTMSDGSSTASANVSLSVYAPGTTFSLFPGSTTPGTVTVVDFNPVELGVKFSASTGGTITGIRFYKGAQNTGPHVGSLWTSTGTLLASATFTGETASGWQTVTFSNPVHIAAGTTYVAGYSTNGFYSADSNYFASAHSSGPLTAPASGSSGGNGVYTYGTGSPFPTSTYNATNYWVDVTFSSLTSQPPVANNDSGFTATENAPLTISASALLANDTDPNGYPLSITQVSAPTNGTVGFDSASNTITFTPTSGYTGNAGFTYSITDGHGGTASANVSLVVTAPSTTQTLFSASSTPANTNVNDPSPVELGMKFQSDVAGTISAIQFYKGTGDTGPHTVDLWSSSGTLLASAVSAGETASGWQTVNLSQPVSIAANTTYIAAYHSNGHYAATGDFFGSGVINGHLSALSDASGGGNGVYAYSASDAFPTNSFNKTNYWVDVTFNQLAA